MPALNIRFTDAELNALQGRAAAEGRPVTRLVHDAAIGETHHEAHRARVRAALDEAAALSADVLKQLAER
jgi:hypothetical protein